MPESTESEVPAFDQERMNSLGRLIDDYFVERAKLAKSIYKSKSPNLLSSKFPYVIWSHLVLEIKTKEFWLSRKVLAFIIISLIIIATAVITYVNKVGPDPQIAAATVVTFGIGGLAIVFYLVWFFETKPFDEFYDFKILTATRDLDLKTINALRKLNAPDEIQFEIERFEFQLERLTDWGDRLQEGFSFLQKLIIAIAGALVLRTLLNIASKQYALINVLEYAVAIIGSILMFIILTASVRYGRKSKMMRTLMILKKA